MDVRYPFVPIRWRWYSVSPYQLPNIRSQIQNTPSIPNLRSQIANIGSWTQNTLSIPNLRSQIANTSSQIQNIPTRTKLVISNTKYRLSNQMPVRCQVRKGEVRCQEGPLCLVQESRSLTCHLLFARGTSIRCRCREKGRLWPHTSHQVVNTRISLGRNCHMSLLIRANFSTSSLRAN